MPHLRGARHRIGQGGTFSVAWNPDDVREPRFSTPKEIHHLEWIMRHEQQEEPAQIALPEAQEKIRTTTPMGR